MIRNARNTSDKINEPNNNNLNNNNNFANGSNGVANTYSNNINYNNNTNPVPSINYNLNSQFQYLNNKLSELEIAQPMVVRYNNINHNCNTNIANPNVNPISKPQGMMPISVAGFYAYENVSDNENN